MSGNRALGRDPRMRLASSTSSRRSTWRLIRRHPAIGAHTSKRRWRRWRELVAARHERYDGTGYPHGLAGEEIPLGSRMCMPATPSVR